VKVSLTSVLPALAPCLGLTSQALYERKRALIRLGLLPSPQGRGRRGGASAEPSTIALLVTAVMVTDNLSDTDGRVEALAAAEFRGRKHRHCPITGANTFHEALTFLLSDQAPISVETDTILEIKVSRLEPMASISYFAWPGLAEPLHTEFGARGRQREDVLSVNAELRHQAVLAIREVALAGKED